MIKMTSVVPSFSVQVAPSKFKVIPQDVQSLNILLIIQEESQEDIENFTYLGVCISSDGSVSDETGPISWKTLETSGYLGVVSALTEVCLMKSVHGCQRPNSCLLICATCDTKKANHLASTVACSGLKRTVERRVYQATVRAVLLCGCETWPVRAVELRRLQVFDNRCLRTIACMGWGPRDPHCAWLETLQDMAANRCQWRSCCQFLSRSPETKSFTVQLYPFLHHPFFTTRLLNKSWLYGSEASVLNTDVMLSMMMMMMRVTALHQTQTARVSVDQGQTTPPQYAARRCLVLKPDRTKFRQCPSNKKLEAVVLFALALSEPLFWSIAIVFPSVSLFLSDTRHWSGSAADTTGRRISRYNSVPMISHTSLFSPDIFITLIEWNLIDFSSFKEKFNSNRPNTHRLSEDK
ncbi:hypothetical protein T265_01083 [Opisthorchis viverrini]|uniref:Uncharacterized protein n=1 Tax=Opisthorchis viverrini TaxID=6198 RepID=A0A075A0V2_OPIVI|nr:hypothetical protein T265_01083 [Opisthorchis viverrini]KER32996.1 hypothetical protein T265_01083 [Opisthorchis viverrini]